METSGRDVQEEALAMAMTAYQGGDMAAFEALYAALAPPLGRYLGALTRDAARAEDLLQEAFLQLHRARRTYLPPRPVKPWAYAIARNVFLMSRRAATRRGRHETLADEELPEVGVPPEAESLGERDAVRRALVRVAEDRREALLLHHVHGLSFREVGAVQGVSEGAAKLRAHRGMAELRAILAPRSEGG